MAVTDSCDHITDFAPGVDHIFLSFELSFGAFDPNVPGPALLASKFHIGPAFSAADQRIDYIPANGWLVYDSNGSAVAAIGNSLCHARPAPPHAQH